MKYFLSLALLLFQPAYRAADEVKSIYEGDEVTINVPAVGTKSAFIHVSYSPELPCVYGFLTDTVDLAGYLSGSSPRSIIGGYHYSRMRYIRHAHNGLVLQVTFKVVDPFKLRDDLRQCWHKIISREEPPRALVVTARVYGSNYDPDKPFEWRFKVQP